MRDAARTFDDQVTRQIDHDYGRIACAADRLFGLLLVLQWFGTIIMAVLVAPRTWIGASSAVHIHVWTAVFLGGIITSLPLFLIWRHRGEAITRHVIAIAQMCFSIILIHLSGGRIETHFHVFGSLAFLAMYRDFRILLTATAVVGVDHLVRGALWPESVFGVLTEGFWRPLEHIGWVLFEDAVLITSCRRSRSELELIAERTVAAARAKADVDRQVEVRTSELVEARLEAEAASRAKGSFLANMSHEIRTPMTAIIGFTDVLLAPESTGSDRHNAAHTIRRNGQHLLTLVNDILDMSKIEAGMLTVERMNVDTRQMLTDVMQLMSIRAEEHAVTLTVESIGRIPATVRSDPTRLKQALVNLVGNAIKFTTEGTVSIKVRVDLAGETIAFEVHDTGVGMTADQMSKLFTPFCQGDVTTTRRFGGTGLGLTITKHIAELLGGTIDVSSEPNVGSVFTMIVPTGSLAGVQMVEAPDPTVPAAPERPQHDGLPRLDGRILVVEDGPDNQRLISHFLRVAGATVEIAENGQIGIEMIRAALASDHPYDIVLMDMQMPVKDGYTATRELRADGYDGEIIALTAHAMQGELQKCLDAGCSHFLSKPIERAILVREVARSMWHARHRAA